MATPPQQQQPPTGSNNTKWKQKFQNQRSMKPTLIQPPSKPTNHHSYSSAGHQKPIAKLKTKPENTKSSPPKPNTDDPPHHRERQRHSNLMMTHPTTDLITDLHQKRGSGRQSAPPYTRHSCWEHWCWESKSQGTTREGRAGDWWERRIEGGLGCREKLKERESEREADWDWEIYKCKIFYQYFKCKTSPWLYCFSENILPLTKCFTAK